MAGAPRGLEKHLFTDCPGRRRPSVFASLRSSNSHRKNPSHRHVSFQDLSQLWPCLDSCRIGMDARGSSLSCNHSPGPCYRPCTQGKICEWSSLLAGLRPSGKGKNSRHGFHRPRCQASDHRRSLQPDTGIERTEHTFSERLAWVSWINPPAVVRSTSEGTCRGRSTIYAPRIG